MTRTPSTDRWGVDATWLDALDAEIRLLRLRRTLLQAVCRAGTTTEEMSIVSDLAALSARERQRIVDDFVALARSFGVPARAVDGFGEEFAAALAESVEAPGPDVLVVRAALTPPPSSSPRWYRRRPVAS